MASIVKRNNKYNVVYYYIEPDGKKRQRWECCDSHKAALARKAEIENAIYKDTFIAPQTTTVADLMRDFVEFYGAKKWGLSTYDSNVGLIENYILPIMGDMRVQDVTPRYVDRLYSILPKTRSVMRGRCKPKNEFLAPPTIMKIHKLLKCAFKQAVRWELVSKNPFEMAITPKSEYKHREMWTAETIRTALDACRDGRLFVAINLAFACSMRIGEICGLEWRNVHITDDDIARDDAHVYIEQELYRASRKSIETTFIKDVIKVFPPLKPNTKTVLVLKKPKTKSSERKVWLPRALAYILREWKKWQDGAKEVLGSEYEDSGLVLALPNGRPCEGKLIEESFQRLKEQENLPNVVFHSLRHSSTTYKLKLNHGDLKATQGDTGHAQVDMITRIYAHILDEDRKVNAQRFNTAFYGPDLRQVKAPVEQPAQLDLQDLIRQLQESPELARALAGIISAGGGKRGDKGDDEAEPANSAISRRRFLLAE